jgi:hypothetical protein
LSLISLPIYAITPLFLQHQYAEFRRLSRDDNKITTQQEEEEAMDEEKKEENAEDEEELPEEPMPETTSSPVPLSGKKRSRRSSGRG